MSMDSDFAIAQEIAALAREEQDKQDQIAQDIAYLRSQVETMMVIVGEIKNEVSPLIEQLSNNPMFKMLMGGKNNG